MSPPESIVEKFFNSFITEPNSGCWLWIGPITRLDYGIISSYRAHRLSYEIHKGVIPLGMWICHKCDTPSCVNPDHLWAGTPYDNVHDMIKKGRGRMVVNSKPHIMWGDQNYSRKHPEIHQGSNHGNSKLTEKEVLEIRELASKKVYSRKELSQKYQISLGNLGNILRRAAWRHI